LANSETEVYPVVLRGINRQAIFEDDEDREMFLVTVDQHKKQSGFKLLAFCLMGNHVHFLKFSTGYSLTQKNVCYQLFNRYSGF
jgi:REP element-mobilizing transposase RayT